MVGRSNTLRRETLADTDGRSLSLIRARRTRREGVRASIIASKSGNADGAKGCRKVDTREHSYGKRPMLVTVCEYGLRKLDGTEHT